MTQGTLLSRFPVCLLKSFFSRKHPVLTLENSKGKSPSCRMGKVQGSRRNPAQRFRWESEEKVCLAHEKSPKAFFIALGLFLSLERATRLELATSTARSAYSIRGEVGFPQMDAGHLWDAGRRVRASLPAPEKTSSEWMRSFCIVFLARTRYLHRAKRVFNPR